MNTEQKEVKQEEQLPVENNQQDPVPPSVDNKPKVELTPERKAELNMELNTIGVLLGATFHKPEYHGKNTKNPTLARSIAQNFFSPHVLFTLRNKANAIMMELGWFENE
jgi:hypothetical protein